MKIIKRASLNDSQMGVYLDCVNNEATLQYNIVFEYTFDKGKVDAARFVSACDKVLSHYAACSACVTLENGFPELGLMDEVPVTRFSKVSQSEYAQIVSHFMHPFVLDRQPLCRSNVYETEEALYLLIEMHHLITDGTSYNIFEKALELAYNGEPIPKEEYSVFDANADESRHVESGATKASYDYFDTLLSGVETDSNLLPDLDGGDMARCVQMPYDLGVSVQDVKSLAQKNGVTENVVLLSAFTYALAKYTGQSEALFTSINGGRRGKPLSNTIGLFVRTFPLYFQIDEEASVGDFIAYVKKNYFETMSHDDASFVKLAHSYGIRSDIKYVYQGSMINDFVFDGHVVKKRLMEQDYAISNLDVMIVCDADGYHLLIYYRKALYSEENVLGFAKLYSNVVRGMLSCDRLKEIALTSDEEKEKMAAGSSSLAYDRNQTVWRVLDNHLRNRADKVAVCCKDNSLTYAEFDRVTAKIAAYLSGKGIGRENFVAVLIPRCELMPVTAWGVVRTGAAYQPLDPSYPRERLNFMVKDAGAKLLIADRSLRPLLDEYEGDVLFTDEIDSLPDALDFQPKDTPNSAMVIIYTSGTTGTPKGCVLENRNIVCFHHNHVKNMELDADSRVATYASFGFDAGIMDIFTTLMAGASLYVVPDEIRLDIQRLNQFYHDNHITHGFITTQVGRMFAEMTDCESLKTLLVGGEKLVPFNPPTRFRFINGYGPSETIAYVCCHHVTDASPIQPIGFPSDNIRLYVVDKMGRLLPQGACGELCIAGGQVGRGYLNRPDKTAEAFVPNPFCSDVEYDRMYRTGDMARLLGNGEFDFIGRRDGQVKIRGFRVELTEIEEIIRRYKGVTDATVVAKEESGGGKYIVAYVVGNERIDRDGLAQFIRGEKPAYMVPAVIMQIEAIPYTQNQKVNKRALPEPVRTAESETLEKPQTESQQRIFDIVTKVIGHDALGITTNLFEAGLTSIGTLKLNMELGKAFDKPFKLNDLKNHNTIQSIDEFLSGKAAQSSFEKRSDYPLMWNQMGVWVESSMKTDSLDYNIPMLFKLSPLVDIQRLRQSIGAAMDAHPYIKAVMKSDEKGEIRAVRNDDTEVVIDVVKVPKLPESNELIKPFDLLDARLYRVAIYMTEAGNYLFMDVHHIISDGTSLGILIHDVNAAYKGDSIENERYTAYEAALEEDANRKSDNYAEGEKYYESLLSGCNTECLPAKCPEKAETADDVVRASFPLDGVSASVIEFCQKRNITLNAFFNAAFSYTLSLFLHADSVTYCTVYNGRNDSRLMRDFAMLVKTLPVCCSCSPDETVEDFIQKMQRQLMDSMANDVVPFADLAKKYALKSDLFFNYQGDEFDFDMIGDQKAEPVSLNFAAAKAPLAIEVFLKEGVFSVDVTYRTDYFCKEFVDSFVAGLACAAGDFVRCVALKQVSIFSEKERSHFAQMNATDVPFQNLPPQHFVTQWVKSRPDAVAVKTATKRLTFAELDRLSDRVAASLIESGVHADDIVAMILDRSEWVPVVEIGILKAGGAFLPMLPSYPDDRLTYCMDDSKCRFVISSQDIISKRGDLFSSSKRKNLSVEQFASQKDSDVPEIQFSPSQLAYCIYTSGSTGTPKGVMVEHHNLSNYVQTSAFKEVTDSGSVMLCMSSISFDMSLTEIFFTLCQGKTIYIASEEEIHNLDKLLLAFKRDELDLMVATPSFVWNLVSLPDFEGALSRLKGIVLGAEALPPTLFAKLRALNPELLIQNGYGPTECTQACSAKKITDPANITIGGPFPNTKFYVMDVNGNLLPRYAVGELMICGECVSRGYIGLPEKNAASFTVIDGCRAYHSGDLVRINRDNEAEFGGRADNQVKLRGFRVELDEVENVMCAFPGVTQSKVVVRNNGTEDFLAGFFTAEKPVDLEELTSFMKKKLTYYMVPAAMMQLDKMPMTPNGKLDKKALPEIRPVKKAKAKRVPKKSLEERILDVFRTVLQVEDCYVDDNFFEIGGTSLSASKVVMQLKSEGHKIEYQDIFDYQSAEELADYLESIAPAAQSAAPQREDSLVHQDEAVVEMLKYNTMEFANEVERRPLGDVLLTGATGFLGNHVLKELIDNETGKIYCLVRKGSFDDLATRLKSMLYYYFEDNCEEAFEHRIVMIEGDITEENLSDKFKDISFDTLINCAACVKHYANDNSIEFVNVHGVEILIALAKEKNAKMVQISTTSVPGVHNEQTYRANICMTENQLFVVDDMNNQYGRSKYHAELLMLDAIRNGMRGKIIRVGNLMGRYSDGEFQTNMRTNAFLNGLRGFVAIGKCPISHSTDPMSFSPVDCTAKAVVLLAGTNDKFTAFNADSRSSFDEAKLIEAVNRCGLTVKPVPDEEYYADFYRMMGDQKLNKKVSALLTNDRPDLHVVNTDNRFTANILYRLGFSWPFIEDVYLQKVIKALDSMGFFWME